jgi:hypothetical protein
MEPGIKGGIVCVLCLWISPSMVDRMPGWMISMLTLDAECGQECQHWHSTQEQEHTRMRSLNTHHPLQGGQQLNNRLCGQLQLCAIQQVKSEYSCAAVIASTAG